MRNQETGLRGYLLTGRDGSLEPYRDGRRALEGAVRHLRELIGADAMQATRLAEAETAARAWQSDVGEASLRNMADPSTSS